ncbi:2869_t:CDS:2, partial [Racocetra fulgida]
MLQLNDSVSICNSSVYEENDSSSVQKVYDTSVHQEVYDSSICKKIINSDESYLLGDFEQQQITDQEQEILDLK